MTPGEYQNLKKGDWVRVNGKEHWWLEAGRVGVITCVTAVGFLEVRLSRPLSIVEIHFGYVDVLSAVERLAHVVDSPG